MSFILLSWSHRFSWNFQVIKLDYFGVHDQVWDVMKNITSYCTLWAPSSHFLKTEEFQPEWGGSGGMETLSNYLSVFQLQSDKHENYFCPVHSTFELEEGSCDGFVTFSGEEEHWHSVMFDKSFFQIDVLSFPHDYLPLGMLDHAMLISERNNGVSDTATFVNWLRRLRKSRICLQMRNHLTFAVMYSFPSWQHRNF